jgi:hypothetical protein
MAFGIGSIEKDIPSGLPNVVFKAPDGTFVIVVLNESDSAKDFNIQLGKRHLQLLLKKDRLQIMLLRRKLQVSVSCTGIYGIVGRSKLQQNSTSIL